MQRRTFTAIGIFVFSSLLFTLLRTQQYLAVDGATRCTSVYWQGRPIFGGNNHLLYFFNVYVWSKALSLVGVNANNPFHFLRLTEVMNAFAAGGSVSLLFLLCRGASKSFNVALAATLAYAFSHGFLLHATSTAEPMVGLFWSVLSVLVVASGLATPSRLRLLAGGALLLLAMATYESMVLVGPAEAALIFYWNEEGPAPSRGLLKWFLAGCVLGWILIYVPAYAFSGTTNPTEMARQFLSTGGGESAFGGVRLSKVLNLPIGFSNAIVPTIPADYQGVRWLLKAHDFDRTTLSIFAILVIIGTWTAWTLRRLAFIWNHLEPRQHIILRCCALALAFDLFSLLFWDPLYDKLWLQPVAVVFLAWSIIFAAWLRLFRPRLMVLPEGLLLVVILLTNLASAFEAHRVPTPCVDAAHDLAAILKPPDLLVTGWDAVTLLYDAFWRTDARRFHFTSTAIDFGSDTPRLLDDAIAETRARGGRVYFLGVLDMPENTWQPFLGDRAHLQYHLLDPIRRCANPIAKLDCAEASAKIVWELPRNCGKP